MHSSMTNSRTKRPLNISDVAPRFGSTKLVTKIIRAALAFAVLAALLLIAARPAQAQTETVLYNFTGGSDGADPQSRLTFDAAGTLYGTTNGGGALGAGTVFELSPNGNGGWNEKVLYSFTGGADGGNPTYSYVMFDSVGNLYGTAAGGGAYGYGVAFELSPVGASWTETVLHSFAGGADGADPINGLIMDLSGNLYGTTFTAVGVGYGTGTVFELSPSGGGWTEQVIYSYAYKTRGDYHVPGLTMDASGHIFGITNYPTVFELWYGNGGWNRKLIHTFPRTSRAWGTPVLDQAGNLYGTTFRGGANDLGTVYKLSPGKKGAWTEKILYSFTGNGVDGFWPWAGIVFDAAGNIYGTTLSGGGYNDGTVFELVAPVGAGSYNEKVLWSFNGSDGYITSTGLILDSAGNLYGTSFGGAHGDVYEVTGLPAATTTTLTSSPNPSTYGQAVTFTAVVTSSRGAPPDGETVSFMKVKTVLGTGTLSGGSASFTTSTLKVGTTTVTALYFGDSNLSGSTSNTVKQVVQK
jgi:uncharacterized repeat protein (TIGR03803 family)